MAPRLLLIVLMAPIGLSGTAMLAAAVLLERWGHRWWLSAHRACRAPDCACDVCHAERPRPAPDDSELRY